MMKTMLHPQVSFFCDGIYHKMYYCGLVGFLCVGQTHKGPEGHVEMFPGCWCGSICPSGGPPETKAAASTLEDL